MKKLVFILGIVFILAGTAIWFTPTSPFKPNLKKDRGPGNPGWYRQWTEMKMDETGKIPYDRIRALFQLTKMKRLEKAGSNLTNLQELGPSNVGGRTRAFLVDKNNYNRLFAGGVSGGLWVSSNGGALWTPVDDQASNLSISFITQNPFTPQVIYFSTGECAGNSAGIPGDGVYKSMDNGVTFMKLPSSDTPEFDYTWRIACSLTDTHTVFVATRDAGLFRSTNAGNSFENVLPNVEVTDLEVFRDGSVIAAVSGQGLFRSNDGSFGTFTSINNGLPTSGFYRVEMAYCDSVPDVMYVTYESPDGDDILGLYKTTDGGVSWTATSNPSNFNIGFYFPWYCLTLAVKPSDPNFLVIAGVSIGYSTNGGTGWIEHQNSHGDYHIVVFNPANQNQFYVGNDGGLYKYYDTHFIAYVNLNNHYNVTQFYTGTFFPQDLRCWGGTQDNGTQSGSDVSMAFNHIFGGDGAFTAINQQSPYIGYASWQNGHILRTNDATNPSPYFDYVMGEMDADYDYEIDDDTWFINPFELNRQDGDQIFFVTRKQLWRSVNGANIWEKCTNPITDLYAIGISNEEYPTVYVGGKNKLRRLDDAYDAQPGDEVNLSSSIPGNLAQSFMSNITVSANDPGTFYVSFNSYINQPRVWKVTNGLTSSPQWQSIHGDLPVGLPVNWIEVSPYNEDIMAAATDFGLYTSVNGGVNWVLETGLPNVAIHQIRLRYSDNTLFIFTHGRGIWSANLPMTGFDVADESTKHPIRIYPTLTDNTPIQVEIAENTSYEFVITDMSGRTLYISEIHQSLMIDPTLYKSGVYIVYFIYKGRRVYAQKIIIQ